MDRRDFIMAGSAALASPGIARAGTPEWVQLPTEAYRGKQDDIAFVNRRTGWYGNGQGKLFATQDGGDSWTRVLDRPGTFVRALGFVDERLGFLGNIGPDY
ncbi:MAG: WD40/YVTN/BNR-like repeat-containing protein, partial [Brevundimonas sp.]